MKPGDKVTVKVIQVKNWNSVEYILEVVLAEDQKLAGRTLSPLEPSEPEDYPKK